jgi:hypothetical protein
LDHLGIYFAVGMNTILFCGDEAETPEGGPDKPESNPITRILSTISKALVLDSSIEAGMDVPLVI